MANHTALRPTDYQYLLSNPFKPLCLFIYEAYSESKYQFAVKISSKVSYKILLLSDSTFFKLLFHVFAAIIGALIVTGHKFLYTLLTECGRLRPKWLLKMS